MLSILLPTLAFLPRRLGARELFVHLSVPTCSPVENASLLQSLDHYHLIVVDDVNAAMDAFENWDLHLSSQVYVLTPDRLKPGTKNCKGREHMDWTICIIFLGDVLIREVYKVHPADSEVISNVVGTWSQKDESLHRTTVMWDSRRDMRGRQLRLKHKLIDYVEIKINNIT